jgi:NtrC-family two-component system response regulator AlgB
MNSSSAQAQIGDEPQALRILIVDDEPNIRRTLSLSLTTDGHRVTAVSNPTDAASEAMRQPFDLAFVDLRLGTETGLDLIPKLLAQSPWLMIVVITAYATIETAVEAIKRGATDYLPKPFTPPQVRLVVERLSRVRALEQRLADLQGSVADSGAQIDLDSRSPAMRRAINMARDVAASDATILIRGDSGTGKGVLARAIHSWSDRAAKPFGVVSCPTLSPQLLESELFGHVLGAFTGAVRDNPGRIAATAGGTLFLDEIGDLPLGLQPKLLRFVQDREYERVGDTTTRLADVRLITATNVDLNQARIEGKFREDLLYRINVVQIDLPPLRERAEDLLPLAEKFLAYFSKRRPISGFGDQAIEAMQTYAWPGNVRELRNVVERAAILCKTELVGPEFFPTGTVSSAKAPRIGEPFTLAELEEEHLRRVLGSAPSLDEASRILGIDAATLYRRRKKYGI